MRISYKKIFFWDQNDLSVGGLLVLDPLSNCGRAYLECPRMIPSVELGGPDGRIWLWTDGSCWSVEDRIMTQQKNCYMGLDPSPFSWIIPDNYNIAVAALYWGSMCQALYEALCHVWSHSASPQVNHIRAWGPVAHEAELLVVTLMCALGFELVFSR